MYTISLKTKSGDSIQDITHAVASVVAKSGIKEGFCLVSSPHTTAGITVNENSDPDVKSDILMELGKIVPLTDNYRHMEGNSAAHLKASLMGFSAVIPVSSGKIVLGIWQGIYFCEFDGPRERKVNITVTGS